MTWKLADAKNRLTEVVNLALAEGPQVITRRNDTVVLVSAQRYAELTGQQPDFKEFLFQTVGLDQLDLTRDPSPSRDVAL
jgi:antitoxin Phd